MQASSLRTSGSELAAQHLAKRFALKDGRTVEAIADLTFSVAAGEFVSVVGPSGAGKTTLLKIIAGLIPPGRGRVLLNGERVVGPIEDFGMVFQNPLLLPWRSACDNVLLPIEMLRRDRKRYKDRALELLEIVGLGGFEGSLPHQLSGGMQQRVALCRSLIHDPAILLMDEPFGAVDELTRQSLNDYLLTLWEGSRQTVVFVTHSVAEAVYLSDRIAVLTPRPARLVGIAGSDLPRPRRAEMRYEPDFVQHVRDVQEMMRPAR